MKRLSFLVSLALINTMFCVRVDFHSRVIFMCVNEIEAMYERLCVNAKIEPSLNFYVYAQTFIHTYGT